uniref:Uncharacterized protein n=1 Tax=viral metagenome TaxID=1070528 RepID=A0A6C0BLH0_9ZZZZ
MGWSCYRISQEIWQWVKRDSITPLNGVIYGETCCIESITQAV